MRFSDQEQVLTEEAWWNRYGGLHDQIWQYSDELSELVRSGYLTDMEQFLFVPDGRLLDYGCGTGWVGLRVARRGMCLRGVDLSQEQIQKARKNAFDAGVLSARFSQGGIEQITADAAYDAVILHALIHHLDEGEQEALMARLARALRVGGRIYAYEPAAARRDPPIGAWLLDKALLASIRILRALVFHLRLQHKDVRQAMKNGWTMRSPNEAPLDLESLEDLLPEQVRIVDVTYWHMCTVAHANICMELRKPWRGLLARLMPVPRKADDIILRTPWRVYLQAWPMVGIKMEKL